MKNKKIEDNKLSWEKEKTLRQIWASLPLEDAQAFASAMKFVIDYNYEQGKKDGQAQGQQEGYNYYAEKWGEPIRQDARKQLLDEIMEGIDTMAIEYVGDSAKTVDQIQDLIKSKYEKTIH